MKLQMHSNFTSNPTMTNQTEKSSSSSVVARNALVESSSTRDSTTSTTTSTVSDATASKETSDWWSHRRQFCNHHRQYRQQQQEQLDQAHRVADVIGKRNFENRINITTTTGGILPSGFGYGVLVGGATFVVMSIPAMMLARPLGSMIGRHAARVSMRLVLAVAAGTVATRYVSRYQTLEDLKIMGTYLSPTETSPSADAISQHPIILQAIRYRQNPNSKGEQSVVVVDNTTSETSRLSQPILLLDSWKPSEYYSRQNNQYWWRPSMDNRILAEYDNVLAHCEERNLFLRGAAKSSEAQ